jgi:hypothetical protein
MGGSSSKQEHLLFVGLELLAMTHILGEALLSSGFLERVSDSVERTKLYLEENWLYHPSFPRIKEGEDQGQGEAK